MDLIEAGEFWEFIASQIVFVFDRMRNIYIMFPDGGHSLFELFVSIAVISSVLSLLGFASSRDDVSDDDN